MSCCPLCDFCIEIEDGTLFCVLRDMPIDDRGECPDEQCETRLIDGDDTLLEEYGYY